MRKCFWVSLACLVLASAAIEARQFPNPTDAQNRQYRNNPCRDPWISYGIIVASGGAATAQGVGDHGECDYRLYLGGRWNNFNQLVEGIQATRVALSREGVRFAVSRERQGTRVALFDGPTRVGSKLIGVDGGGVIGNDGGSIVAAGAGNFSLQSVRKTIKVSNGHNLVVLR